MGPARRPAKRSARGPTAGGFTEEEKSAMREYIQERKAGEANDESAVLAKIAKMAEPDRSMARRLHAIIRANAPGLSPRTWYGMPAYADKDGKVVCFFQDARKFKARYSTLGFSDKAHLDEGAMWPSSYALKELNGAEEARIAELVRRAVGRG